MRKYIIVCPSCNGLGEIENPNPISSQLYIACPACNGNKVVEVIDDGINITNPLSKERKTMDIQELKRAMLEESYDDYMGNNGYSDPWEIIDDLISEIEILNAEKKPTS